MVAGWGSPSRASTASGKRRGDRRRLAGVTKTSPETTTPILPSGRPQGSGAGWVLVLAGYLVLIMLVFGHEPTPASDQQPAARPPVARPEPPQPIEEPPPLFDEPEAAAEHEAVPAAEPEPGPESESGPGTPEALDRDAIAASVDRVKSRILACGERNPTPGVVKLRVKVSASGRVSSVEVQQSPERKLGACVASTMKRARFAPTQRGGSFTYPFSF